MKKTIALSIGLVAMAIFICVLFKGRNAAEPSAAMQPEVVTSIESNEPPATLLPALDVSPVPLLPVEAKQPERTVFQRIADNETNVFKLSPGQIQAFLARNKTNADSLLTAFSVTHDGEFLREAARRYPSNALVLASLLGYDVSPGQRRELIEQFKQVSPENPLANYLSAREYTKNQQPELALHEFIEASAKNGFQDFSVERLQGMEELYLSSGYSAAEAKALAMASLEFPALGKLRDVGRDMSALERQYAAAGDATSAQELARMGLGLAGNALNAGVNSLLSQMVGNRVERDFLNGLDPNGSYDFLAQPVGERLTQLKTQEKAIRSEAKFFDVWLATANEAQLVSYFDRLKLYGESAALTWARNQINETSQP